MSEKVHIRVGDGRKDKWNSHTDDHADKYGSMSELIRHAVERQIELDTGDTTGTSGTSQTVEPNGRIDDIKVGVEDNSDTLEAIEDRLADMHNTMVSQGGIPDSAYSAVYGALPVVKEGFEDADKDAVAEQFGAEETDIADEAGVSVEEAGRALVQLRYEYDDVQMLMTREFDAPRYWREPL